MTVLLTLLLTGLAQASEDRMPSAEEVAVHRALSARHFDGDCDRIEALSLTPTATLLHLVQTASSPPWVPMRAAACLTRNHAEAIQPELERWVTDPALLGLGIQTLSLLDAMPEPVAVAVATEALASGPAELDARERVAEARSPALRALVQTP